MDDNERRTKAINEFLQGAAADQPPPTDDELEKSVNESLDSVREIIKALKANPHQSPLEMTLMLAMINTVIAKTNVLHRMITYLHTKVDRIAGG